jgi:hypothetical protein
MNRQEQKNRIARRREHFAEFNDWELQLRERPESSICLAAVFELYDLMPAQARQRPVDVSGIITMRSELACLV